MSIGFLGYDFHDVSVFYAQLGPWIHAHASVYVTFWWFLQPLISSSHLFGASPDEYMIWIFWELTSGIISVCSALGSTVDTYSASVYGCF